jgi:hypothetical protein
VAASTLELDMQHERPAIGQHDVEDLVSHEYAAGQFNVERVSLAYVSMQ